MSDRGKAVERALGYPYEVPDRSFAQVGERTIDLDELEVDLSARSRLLAYGSNAAPEVLARKLAGDSDPAVLLRATLLDHDVVYSAHVSAYGAVPATLLPSPGTVVDLFVAYITAAQLELIAVTEPNYDLTELRGVSCRVDGGEELHEVAAYVSRHGCLRDGEDSPIALSAVAARARRFPARPQAEALALIAANPPR